MRLKVVRLKEGRLEFVAFREPKEGDTLLEGEAKVSESFSVELRERLIPGPTENELKAARVLLAEEGRQSLKESFMRTGMSEKAAELAARGRGR